MRIEDISENFNLKNARLVRKQPVYKASSMGADFLETLMLGTQTSDSDGGTFGENWDPSRLDNLDHLFVTKEKRLVYGLRLFQTPKGGGGLIKRLEERERGEE